MFETCEYNDLGKQQAIYRANDKALPGSAIMTGWLHNHFTDLTNHEVESMVSLPCLHRNILLSCTLI